MHPESHEMPKQPERDASVRAMPDDFEAGRFATLVAAAATDTSGSRTDAHSDLHRAVYAFVARLKAEGLPPERVLVVLTAAAHFDEIAGVGSTRAREIRGVIVGWVVDAYYAAT